MTSLALWLRPSAFPRQRKVHWGSGFFNMVAVDDELEQAIKEALSTDELPEKELEGFTVHQDARKSLELLAKEYLERYPALCKDYNETWLYATFEVRDLQSRLLVG